MVTKAEEREWRRKFDARLAQMEEILGTFIGSSLGGAPGGALGRSAVELYQVSPAKKQQMDLRDYLVEKAFGRLLEDGVVNSKTAAVKKPRKASAYNKAYAKEFKRLSPKYKKKNGQWKKNGFKNCCKECHKCCKKKVKKK